MWTFGFEMLRCVPEEGDLFTLSEAHFAAWENLMDRDFAERVSNAERREKGR